MALPNKTQGPLKPEPPKPPQQNEEPEPAKIQPSDPTPSPKVKMVALYEASYRDNPAAFPKLIKVAAPDEATATAMVSAVFGTPWVRVIHEGKILVLTENQ